MKNKKLKIFLIVVILYIFLSLFLPIFPQLVYGWGGCGMPGIDENGNQIPLAPRHFYLEIRFVQLGSMGSMPLIMNGDNICSIE